MDKSINLIILDIKKDMLKVLTRDNLPITIIQMIVNEIATQVNVQSETIINNELKEYEQTLNDKQDNIPQN